MDAFTRSITKRDVIKAIVALYDLDIPPTTMQLARSLKWGLDRSRVALQILEDAKVITRSYKAGRKIIEPSKRIALRKAINQLNGNDTSETK